MSASMSKSRMVGHQVEDRKKNTAHAKRVNDRLRRRAKRIERAKMVTAVKAGTYNSLTRK